MTYARGQSALGELSLYGLQFDKYALNSFTT